MERYFGNFDYFRQQEEKEDKDSLDVNDENKQEEQENEVLEDEVEVATEENSEDEILEEEEVIDENDDFEYATSEEEEENVNEETQEENEPEEEKEEVVTEETTLKEEPKKEVRDEFDEEDDYNLDNFEPVAKIKVIGVGGAGNNAVNRMIDENIANVEFYVMNTDKQALSTSKARNRLVLGKDKYRGLGAGGDPRIGQQAAEESEEEIRACIKGADMVFIAAGEGGGTGTGASPIVARIAREEGALTVAIVTRPFSFEGKRRISQAVEGLTRLKEHVDAIIIVSNDKLLMMSGQNSVFSAFAESDKVLAQSVKTVSDLILLPGLINLDFADIKSTLKDAGVALIGFGIGKGPNKVHDAASTAISSPLLEASIKGANSAIISVTCGQNVSLFEAQDAANEICEAAGVDLDMKFGVNLNTQLTDEIIISVIATDFKEDYDFASTPTVSPFRPKPVEGENSEENVESTKSHNEEAIIPNYLKGRK